MIRLKELKGLSGCRIELLEESSGKYFVRKTSASLAYNERLAKQVAKQKAFTSSVAKAPEVYDVGFNEDGTLFCLMEYVHGVSFAEFLKLYPFRECLTIFENLLSLVFNMQRIHASETDHTGDIRRKIEELLSKKIGFEVLLERLEAQIPKDLDQVTTHGDLTFENILIDQHGDIYLIDFLDSFVDNTFIDLGKLNQELSLKWSVRKGAPDTDVAIKYQKLNQVFRSHCEKNNIDRQKLLYFSILTLLRILPYTTDSNERKIVHQKLELWQKELQ